MLHDDATVVLVYPSNTIFQDKIDIAISKKQSKTIPNSLHSFQP